MPSPAPSPEQDPLPAKSSQGIPHSSTPEYLERRSTATDALGKIKRRCLFGHYLYWCPDWWAYLITTTVTVALVLGNMFVVWSHLGLFENAICWTLLAVAHVSSLRLITSEPGIYPRLSTGEADPLGSDMTIVFCRVCRLRRPPRTSHCYECNVCVLEHDHHCGILGACVGARNLRWFTLYLVTISLAALMGLFWQVRYLGYLALGTDLNGPSSSATAAAQSGYPPLSLGLLLMDSGVAGLVGSGALYYLLLSLTDTTRREAQRRETSIAVLTRPRVLLHNLKKVARPLPSLVEGDGDLTATRQERHSLV